MSAKQSAAKREELRNALDEAKKKLRFAFQQPLTRRKRATAAKPSRFIGYDLETTNIAAGTPRPLYITAVGADIHFQQAIADMDHLHDILVTHFLIEDTLGAIFVAWNANRFDAFFIAAALIHDSRFVLQPYLTKNKVLRGLRISRAEDADNRKALAWEFRDGIAMTGLVGLKLAQFVANFAPDFPKLTEAIDFDAGEEFQPANPKHQAYAVRDSEGLYHAITRAEQIMIEHFNQPLAVTMGGACIKIFTAHIPENVSVAPLIPDVRDLIFSYVMRGGFCYLVRKYKGPVWKYDINQAYAAAMRETQLPQGPVMHLPRGRPPARVRSFIARVECFNAHNTIPFYYRTSDERGRIRADFGKTHIRQTWITSVECEQLEAEGWKIVYHESYAWPDSFTMRDYVDRLETLRTTCDGGPSGPIGTMVKATGNHSYGKLQEQISPIAYILAGECPDDCVPMFDEHDSVPIDHVFVKIDEERKPKAHHQPHLGAWITSHVRMQIRRAALVAPDAWLYADTDCVIYSRDVTSELDIHAKRYGAFKIEEEGAPYLLIAKKVYAQLPENAHDGSKKLKTSAKGLHVRKLMLADFEAWYEGKPPEQDQVQVQSFLQVMQGSEMFKSQHRKGTKV